MVKINPLILVGAAWLWWSWRKNTLAEAFSGVTIPTSIAPGPENFLSPNELRVAQLDT